MAHHDRISSEQTLAMENDFLLGLPIRVVAEKYGVCEKTAAVRRRSAKARGAVFVLCACGRQTHHRGTCAPRVRAFQQRQSARATIIIFPRGARCSFALTDFLTKDSR